jgi:RimJ/RimL family protein N-acetyltransferase
MSRIILETERLDLHEFTAGDLDDLLEIWGVLETMRYFPGVLDRQATRELVERNQSRYEQYGHGLWALIQRSEQKPIGDCGLVIQDIDGVEELEAAYSFNKKYW